MVAVVVKSFRVRAGEQTYFPGEVITGLDSATEKKLVGDGFCEYVGEGNNLVPHDPPGSGQGDDGPNTSYPLAQGSKKRK